ncbi:hypothetical protein AKJ16_DCAP14821 [Drosera capensis]
MEGSEVDIEERKHDGPYEENDNDDQKMDGQESMDERKDVIDTMKSMGQEEHEEKDVQESKETEDNMNRATLIE